MTQGARVSSLEASLDDSVVAFCRAPQRFLVDLALGDPPAARFRMGDESFLVLVEPEAIHAVLNGNLDDFEKGPLYDIPRTMFGDGVFTADGRDWTDQRALLAPLFSLPRMRRLESLISDLVTRQLDAWADLADAGPVDVLAATNRLAFDVVGQGLLGISEGALADELFAAVRLADRTESVTLSYLTRRLANAASLGESFARSETLRAVDRVYELTYAVADERLARPHQPDDLVGAALSDPRVVELPVARKRTFVRDLIATMISAGYVSTGESMFWALHLLARHPEAQARARTELGRGLARAGEGRDSGTGGQGTPDASPFITAVLNESLRLYPAVWFIGRVARRATRVGETDVPAGTRVICSPYVMHRNPAFWPDAELFRPERFLGGAASIASKSFLPFGLGMRACLGRLLALMEMTAMVSATVGRFELSVTTEDAPKLAGAYSLQPRERELIQLRRRV